MMAMEEANQDRIEEIKTWFAEVINGGNDESDTTIEHGLERSTPIDPKRPFGFWGKERPPPWTFLQKKNALNDCRNLRKWMIAHKYRADKWFTPDMLKNIRKLYFPECTEESDEDEVEFIGEVYTERREEDSQPTTSAHDDNKQVEEMNVITIDDDYDEGGCGNEKNAETRPTADNNGFDYDDADADLAVLTLDSVRPSSSTATKRLAGKSKDAPEKKRLKRKATKRNLSNNSTVKQTRLENYFHIE